MISVVLVDDQELVRAGLRAVLENDSSIAVVGEAADGRAGLSLVRELRPEVVLMDLRMPVMNGLHATAAIRDDPRLSRVKVLVLTTFDDDDDIVRAIRAGAAGYLLKDVAADDLRRAVHTVVAGDNVLSPTVTRRVMERVASEPPAEQHPGLAKLTDRELAVLRRVGHGDTNDEIGRSLFISPATARTYVSRLLTKLDARDRTQLAVIAHRSNLVGRDSP